MAMPAMNIEIRVDADRTQVTVRGVIDEDADFGSLAGLNGRIEFDLSGVRRFNSMGVRNWVDAIRPLSRRANVVFSRCSSPVVFQLNMISGFLGAGRVLSFFGPMRCEPCDLSVDHLFDRDDCEDCLPPVRCSGCGRDMELDDIEDQYTLFLREPTRVA